MSLVKAMIVNTTTAEPIPILFNPAEYSITRSASFSDATVPGLEAPLTEYNHGMPEKLSMELFFDTHDLIVPDVRILTERVAKLLELDPLTDEPPICLFAWGTLVFECQLESVTKKFTMFNSLGVPVRATLSVTFRGHNRLDYLLAKNPFRSRDHTKTYIVKEGDTLSHIAWDVYRDPDKWRAIAEHNNIDNPRKLQPGQILKVPPMD